jgi:ribosome biogenesis protein SSF1/2
VQKKTRTHKSEEQVEEEVPKSFVFKRGKIGVYLEDLKHDFRNLLYPYTAKNLVELKKNKIKDYVGAAGQYGVSHMVVFTQTENHNYMRVIKNPHDPQ